MTKKEWCPYKRESLNISNKKGSSRRVRCPVCKKRFMTIWLDCHYGVPFSEECWHEYIPEHKRTTK